METLKALALRKSTRSFKSEQIKKEELNEIIRAGRLAPIAGGVYQNVHLTVIQKKELIDRINDVARIATGNDNISANYGAPTFIVVSVKAIRGAEKANAGCVVENMLLAATDLGLGSVYTWTINFIHDNADVMSSLGLPADFLPVSGVAIGYPVEAITVENEPRLMVVDYK
ncbi:MAG: nitroreductase family protein [Treponema sp.]|jgi:nitroreductase|nr:nitroreductase family protein [Treponema sp.]